MPEACGECKTVFDTVSHGHQDCLVALVKKGGDINQHDDQGKTLLHLAVSEKQSSIAIWLINNNAKLEERDNYQKTPLHEAASKGLVDVVRLLLQKGVPVDHVDTYKNTPLVFLLLIVLSLTLLMNSTTRLLKEKLRSSEYYLTRMPI